MASALTLLPKRKDEKPGEGVRGALKRCHDYLMLGMGPDGGYSYRAPGSGNAGSLADVWAKYFNAWIEIKSPGGDTQKEAKALEDAKKDLDKCVWGLRGSFGGADSAAQQLVTTIRARASEAEAAKDKVAMNRASAELAELTKYWQTAPKTGGRNIVDELKQARENLVNASKQRVGVAYYEREVKDAKGNTVMNGKEKVTTKVPKTEEEIKNEIRSWQAKVASLENMVKNNLAPIGDLSNAQYGALGAWALADWGMEIKTDYWEVTDRFWRTLQETDGAWAYSPVGGKEGGSSSTMGVAGIATLFVTTEFTDNKPPMLIPKVDAHIDRGLAWLDKDFGTLK